MDEIMQVARKEAAAFFASPVAYIFLGAFLAVVLFVFFWVDTFFARNIADVRPLFQWMPVLLIFLVAALTMRLWSEERRAGTLEVLLTLPVSPAKLVLGKFLACFALVTVALLLTLPLPITVSFIGPLDWGPVLGAYVASLFLAAAYIAVGLYVSSRSDNQIVSLIGSVAICGLFYLVGSGVITGLFGHQMAELLKLLGTGSRFESITRGVIDVRDLYYYLSLMGVFLTLNVYSLERLRWGRERGGEHRHWKVATWLLALNLIVANVWLQSVAWARVDITQGHIYSISKATRQYLSQLREPLLIRGYFSARTHPLLAPLVPQLRDLLKEYEVAGHGKVRVEFVDPLDDPQVEREAGEKYGIKPVAFQTASKYQSAVVNSYFDVLIKYGDQYETLGYRDLIEVKSHGEGSLDVRLRDPEYDITRSIKKVLYGYQGSGDLFATITHPVTFHGYISAADRLPKSLQGLRKSLDQVLAGLGKQAGDKLKVEMQDPDAGDGSLAKTIDGKYGFKPLAASLFANKTFYFYMLLQGNGQSVPVPLPESLDKAGLERALKAGLKRFSSGFLKTIALYTPPPSPGRFTGGAGYTLLSKKLREDAVVRSTDLKSGRVPDDADLLVVVGPSNLDKKQLFAIDQFLMQGGTVMVAASPFDVDLGGGAVSAHKRPTGLKAWLANYGLSLKPEMVLDPQNSAFPIPVNRNLGGFVVREIRSVDYPYFVDVRGDGMGSGDGITSGLEQVTVNWPVPIVVDEKHDNGRSVTPLLQSSDQAWTSPSTNIQPDFQAYPKYGFKPGSRRGRQMLAAVVDGRFQSYFEGQQSPLLAQDSKDATPGKAGKQGEKGANTGKDVISGVIDKSPRSARLILFGSSSFLSDTALDLAASATRTRYLNPLQLMQNAVDWSLEDRALLSIRGRSHFSRLLVPMDRDTEMFWEYLNYALALLALAVVYGVHRQLRSRRRVYYHQILADQRG